jgi:Delta24(24(1))-sterol reductase
LVLAHGLYTNACMKGEECVPYTWDLFYEKWGWMLIFWNFCGVPFVYCAQARYLYVHNIVAHQNPLYTAALFGALLLAYYVWDTAQSQRNRFRMMQRGTYQRRPYAFPQLPWGTLHNPSFLRTANGGTLLTDGWWRYARKIHYTMDVVMAGLWGATCGTAHVLPYFYLCFFTAMITHRYLRDADRCSRKYGADWDHYCRQVPYIFIPYVL